MWSGRGCQLRLEDGSVAPELAAGGVNIIERKVSANRELTSAFI